MPILSIVYNENLRDIKGFKDNKNRLMLCFTTMLWKNASHSGCGKLVNVPASLDYFSNFIRF